MYMCLIKIISGLSYTLFYLALISSPGLYSIMGLFVRCYVWQILEYKRPVYIAFPLNFHFIKSSSRSLLIPLPLESLLHSSHSASGVCFICCIVLCTYLLILC